MCLYKIFVECCGCRDPKCTIRPDTLNQRESEWLQRNGGHIFRIISCYRQGNLCIESFINNDPDRLMAYYGNETTQDCRNRRFIIDQNSRHLNVMCDECAKYCRQPTKEVWDEEQDPLECDPQ